MLQEMAKNVSLSEYLGLFVVNNLAVLDQVQLQCIAINRININQWRYQKMFGLRGATNVAQGHSFKQMILKWNHNNRNTYIERGIKKATQWDLKCKCHWYGSIRKDMSTTSRATKTKKEECINFSPQFLSKISVRAVFPPGFCWLRVSDCMSE